MSDSKGKRAKSPDDRIMWYRRVVPERGQPTTNTGRVLRGRVCCSMQDPYCAAEGRAVQADPPDAKLVLPMLLPRVGQPTVDRG
ncbi:MAG: hypothetical protein ACRECH_13885, partial [Nitrososphaerales archaeon]